jgi:hypothetical protein
MKLTKLSLTNFRSFAETQTINFAPVTLLFGPNSVGKSSILMALAYVQQILQKGHCDPKQLDALGGKLVGGFKSLVHGKDVQRDIVIRLDFNTEEGGLGEEYESYIEPLFEQIGNDVDPELFGGMDHRMRFGSLLEVFDDFAIQLTIAYQPGYGAYVKSYEVFFGQLLFGRIDSTGYKSDTYISMLELSHPFFDYPDAETVGNYLDEITPGVKHTGILHELADINEDYDEAITPIAIKPFAGAIPKPGQRLRTNFEGEEPDGSSAHYHHQVFTRLLTQAFVWPLDRVLDYLQKSVFIGPLRTIPTDTFEPNPYPEQGDWSDGTAAWDLLYQNSVGPQEYDPIFQQTKRWFYDKDRFNTSYKMQRFFTHEIYDGYIDPDDEIDDQDLELLDERKLGRPRLWFWDKQTKTDLSPNQIGVGLSQVMPLVVAAHAVKSGIVSIEQPELHIHPAFQVELGDLFTQLEVPVSRRPMFLIETHSEHIILRLLRRIRETTDGELKDGIAPVKPEDISVVYLEPGADTSDRIAPRVGIKATQLEINEDGEFIQRWPRGFFSERSEELF